MHDGEGGAGNPLVGLRRVHPHVEQVQGLLDAGILRQFLLSFNPDRPRRREGRGE